jgi:hypothetical protein
LNSGLCVRRRRRTMPSSSEVSMCPPKIYVDTIILKRDPPRKMTSPDAYFFPTHASRCGGRSHSYA